MAKNIQSRLKSMLIEEIRNHNGQSPAARFGAISFEGLLRIRVAAGCHIGEKPEDFKDPALAALRRELALDSVAEGNNVHSIQAGPPHIPQHRHASTHIV